MNIETDIQPVSDFRTNAAGILHQVQETHRPVVITQRGKGAAVLLDVSTYQALVDELELLRSVHQGLADLEAGRTVPHDEARADLLARYRGE